MWKRFMCRLFREHDYRVSREPGALFLECTRCGVRSRGWDLLVEKRVSRANSTLRLFFADSGSSAPAVDREPEADIWAALLDAGELRLTFGPESRLP
jgi:hypothetical protein